MKHLLQGNFLCKKLGVRPREQNDPRPLPHFDVPARLAIVLKYLEYLLPLGISAISSVPPQRSLRIIRASSLTVSGGILGFTL